MLAFRDLLGRRLHGLSFRGPQMGRVREVSALREGVDDALSPAEIETLEDGSERVVIALDRAALSV